MASYRWLSNTYKDGDTIFLFGESFRLIGGDYLSLISVLGFSRGAYQVRALAGMIARVSLLPTKRTVSALN